MSVGHIPASIYYPEVVSENSHHLRIHTTPNPSLCIFSEAIPTPDVRVDHVT